MSDESLSLSNRRGAAKKSASWAISYSDMVTALLCFFIIFYSLEKQIEKKDQDSVTQKDRDIASVDPKPLSKAQKALDLLKLSEGILSRVDGNILELEFASESFFDKGATGLNSVGKKRLLDIIPQITQIEYKKLEIIAHTDGRQVIDRPNRWWKNNNQLSALRALEAGNFLSSNGIEEKKMIYSGHGEKSSDQYHDADRRLTLRIHL